MNLFVFILDLWLATGKPMFLVPGEGWSYLVPKPLPKEWWAVCGEDIVRATVRAERKDDAGYDLTNVVVKGCEKSELLVRGLKGVAPRKALPAKLNGQEIEWAGRTIKLQLADEKLSLVDGERTQVLSAKSEAGEFRWAGDLDGDGELDLLVDITTVGDGGGGETVLFMSRGHKKGKLVRRVAAKPLSPC